VTSERTPRLPSSVGALEVATLYRPAGHGTEVGGDWFDAFCLADGSTALVIGDVMGHDRNAAKGMGVVRHMLRAIAADRLAPPSEVLSRLDEVVQQFGVVDFATVVYARVVRSHGGSFLLEWSTAGHPPPLLIPSFAPPHLLDGDEGLPLGVGNLPRRDVRHVLPQGADLVLYTDGLVEHRGESLTSALRALTRAADGLHQLPIDALVRTLTERATPSSADDLAVLAVRLPPPGGPFPLARRRHADVL
jgi:serine phosphatase RsbU (regulator of sigma subunit)